MKYVAYGDRVRLANKKSRTQFPTTTISHDIYHKSHNPPDASASTTYLVLTTIVQQQVGNLEIRIAGNVVSLRL